MLYNSSNYITFSIIFSYHIDILPRSIGELPKIIKRHRRRDFCRRRVIFRVKGMGYLRKLQFSNYISWRVFEQSSWKFVHILFQRYERSSSIAFSKIFWKFPTIFKSENTVFLPKFFFWIPINEINSNLQEMEKNCIWIFTLEIFQNFPRSENSESSHRCCISLKTFFG